MTTMEEVFLKVTAGEEPSPAQAGAANAASGPKLAEKDALLGDHHSATDQTSAGLRLRQLSAMLGKRRTYWLRNRKMLFVQLILPIILAAVALAIAIQSEAVVVEPERAITLENFESSHNFWSEQNTGGDYWFCESPNTCTAQPSPLACEDPLPGRAAGKIHLMFLPLDAK